MWQWPCGVSSVGLYMSLHVSWHSHCCSRWRWYGFGCWHISWVMIHSDTNVGISFSHDCCHSVVTFGTCTSGKLQRLNLGTVVPKFRHCCWSPAVVLSTDAWSACDRALIAVELFVLLLTNSRCLLFIIWLWQEYGSIWWLLKGIVVYAMHTSHYALINVSDS